MHLPDQIQLGLLLLTAVGLFLNLLQNWFAARQKAAEYLVDLTQHYSSDQDILDARYMVEYGEFTYNDDFHGSETERKIDKLLDYYDTVARLRHSSHLRLTDLDFMAYDFLVVYQNREIQKYIHFLDGWYFDKVRTQPFECFRKIGEELQRRYARSARSVEAPMAGAQCKEPRKDRPS